LIQCCRFLKIEKHSCICWTKCWMKSNQLFDYLLSKWFSCTRILIDTTSFAPVTWYQSFMAST
jgi:hypothetical protein